MLYIIYIYEYIMSYNQQDDNLATESGRKIMFPINMAFFGGIGPPYVTGQSHGDHPF